MSSSLSADRVKYEPELIKAPMSKPVNALGNTRGEFKISEFIQVINQEMPLRLFHLTFHKFTTLFRE